MFKRYLICANCRHSFKRFFKNYKGEIRSKTYCELMNGSMVSMYHYCQEFDDKEPAE